MPYTSVIQYLGKPSLGEDFEEFFCELVPKGSSVLDAGCGAGDNVRELVKRGFNAYGIDLNPEHLRMGYECYKDQETFVDNEGKPRLRQGDALQLPYRDREFRAVTVFNLLHSLQSKDEIKKCLSESYRILDDNGILYGNTFSTRLLEVDISKIPDDDIAKREAVIRARTKGRPIALTKGELEKYLYNAGFKKIIVKEKRTKLCFKGEK